MAAPGPHYARDPARARTGAASIRIDGGPGSWRGVHQRAVLPVSGPGPPSCRLRVRLWVAAKDLSAGAGVFVDIALHDSLDEAGPDDDSKMTGGDDGGPAGRRPALFLRDATSYISAGTYDWFAQPPSDSAKRSAGSFLVVAPNLISLALALSRAMSIPSA